MVGITRKTPCEAELNVTSVSICTGEHKSYKLVTKSKFI